MGADSNRLLIWLRTFDALWRALSAAA